VSKVVLRWGQRTHVMGIVNVTPDSFSGDGIALPGRNEAEIVAAALSMGRLFVEAGAAILDVGAESTRPAAVYGEHPAVEAATEATLALPVVRALAAEYGDRAIVSVDTSKGSVARAALDAGARMVNDVWAGRRDPGTVAAAAEAGAYLVLMHNREVAEYPSGLMPEIVRWLADARDAALGAGVSRERILVDPGIGFGKTPAHSIEVLRRLGELRILGQPILVGTSRKRFIGELLGGAPPDRRLEGTAATVALAISAGADVVRVHDVEQIVATVRVTDGIVRPAQEAAALTGADRLGLSGLRFDARHGVLPEERERPQPFEVDIVCRLDLHRTGASDAIAEAIDYRVLYGLVRDVMQGPHRDLLEALATDIAEAVLERTPAVDAVEVRVRKLAPPLPGPVEYAEAAVVRARDPAVTPLSGG